MQASSTHDQQQQQQQQQTTTPTNNNNTSSTTSNSPTGDVMDDLLNPAMLEPDASFQGTGPFSQIYLDDQSTGKKVPLGRLVSK